MREAAAEFCQTFNISKSATSRSDFSGKVRQKIRGIWKTCSIQEVGDDFERVALVNEKLLALCGVVHLLCVPGHQRVEEGIVLICSLRSRLALQICIILISKISHTLQRASLMQTLKGTMHTLK